MKRVTIIITLLYILVGSLHAQVARFVFDKDSTSTESSTEETKRKVPPAKKAFNDSISGDSMRHLLPAIPSWRIDSRSGDRIPVAMDTLFNNYHQESLVDGKDVAVGYLGNWGSPAQSKVFFEREESSQFNFLNPFSYYRKTVEDHTFLDTKVPLSNITYQTGGGRKNKEERFSGAMSVSFNKKFTLGFDIDYVYARGFYNSLSTKQNNYDIFASYNTDTYQMHAFVANNNFINLENGGLDLSEGVSSDFFNINSKDLSTSFSNTWNKLRGRQLYMTHKYSVGYNNKDTENFVPVASAFFSTNYTDQRRSFTSDVVGTLDELYHYTPAENTIQGFNTSSDNQTATLNDYMSYYSFKNTLGVSLNEGFRKWVKFGLKVFIEQDIRKYLMSGITDPAYTRSKDSQSSTVIGGVLSKQKGDFLRYNLSADFGVLGYNIGESRLNADISTAINIKEKQAIVKANAYIKNLKPTFFETNFISRYYKWTDNKSFGEKNNIQYNNFSDIRRVYAGGEIYIPHSKTRLSGGVENITNYIYYGKANDTGNTNILQEGNNIQVVAFRLDQKLSAGILHFDNQGVFQASTNEDALPLPKFSIYSNLYLQVKVAKVLDVQLGVDAHFHTKYYAPGYDPALLQFYSQKEREIGGFPLATAYANFHLKKTRFFVMMYNIGKDISNLDYFNLDKYPYNPTVVKFGLSWNFTE